MKHFIAIGVLLFTATSANACRPPYLEYSAVFEPGSATFPAGYTVYMYLRQNEIIGIPRQLAEARARSMTGLLEHLGINKKDIERPEVRSTASGHVASEEEGRFFNEAGISINPRCPHVCCEG